MKVIIYGPPNSGKTRNAEALRKLFGCARVVDGWDGVAPMLNDGDLALTNLPFSQLAAMKNVQVVHVYEALRRLS